MRRTTPTAASGPEVINEVFIGLENGKAGS